METEEQREERVPFPLRLKPSAWARIRKEADKREVPIGKIVEELVEENLD